ncbi:Thioredoxin family protein [Trichomonas vaginalis G3]|uniref:Thioredoxin family protein n=1 Tax=Trichomonas vaginalis (strain ATCC PRA-98 / G3) TaxID=412133 RepID=A2DZ37_TRIV3|nr:cell redox homeostasis [Trichomonas vaginalis G3]EAY14313.1 Thioredoxin family protein [Trichomonas vaginalis G3]KAI5517340.1 cell redox homeostasis [Trichomonas vaginalis G3]|eukprot:XP_001326536.1 Thioredoxin family protein [Trichomonas vaginalis G3]
MKEDPAVKTFKGTFEELKALVQQSHKLFVVDFFANWAIPSKRLLPHLSEIAKEHPDVEVIRIDIDKNEDISDHYQIVSVPHIKLLKSVTNNDFMEVAFVNGCQPDAIRSKIAQFN